MFKTFLGVTVLNPLQKLLLHTPLGKNTSPIFLFSKTNSSSLNLEESMKNYGNDLGSSLLFFARIILNDSWT